MGESVWNTGGLLLTEETKVLVKNLAQSYFAHHKYHIDGPRIGKMPPRRQAGD
jgi:hypothetical protein